VVRKAGKETCLKTSGWKYTRNKFHKFRILTKRNGQITIWVDGTKLMDVKNPSSTNLPNGSAGIFVGHSQIQIKNFQYTTNPKPLVQPKFKDMVKGGFKDGETGGRDWGNSGKCYGGDWRDRGSFWDQPSCNGGGSWLVAKALMGSTADYEFSVDIKNMDNDDSGVVFRYTDKNNFIRFHHTLDYEYNKQTKGGIKGGCQGKGSFLVVRKAGKETCLKTNGWKYARNKFHSFRILSKTNGQITIWVDGSKLMDVKNPSSTNLKKGSAGIFVGHSQIQIKNFKYQEK